MLKFYLHMHKLFLQLQNFVTHAQNVFTTSKLEEHVNIIAQVQNLSDPFLIP